MLQHGTMCFNFVNPIIDFLTYWHAVPVVEESEEPGEDVEVDRVSNSASSGNHSQEASQELPSTLGMYKPRKLSFTPKPGAVLSAPNE